MRDWLGGGNVHGGRSGVAKQREENGKLTEPAGFRVALGDWFAREAKDYPWRRTRDPYAVLVSEVMLQQTQIATVLGKGYYTRFLQAFPDVQALAAADDAALLKAWEGLGYYRRARLLRETARAVWVRSGGVFPREVEELLQLPGIGRYTAGALRAFAFDLPAVVVDGNVARVLARLFNFREPVDSANGSRQIWTWAARLADPQRPAVYHAALMELGQMVCRPGVPDCANCPVADWCMAVAPELLPVKKSRVAITAVDEHALWVRDSRGRVLLHRENGPRRHGLWKLPTRDGAQLPASLPVLTEHCYSITRYRVQLRVYDGCSLRLETQEGEQWCELAEVAELAIAAPFRRVIERLVGAG